MSLVLARILSAMNNHSPITTPRGAPLIKNQKLRIFATYTLKPPIQGFSMKLSNKHIIALITIQVTICIGRKLNIHI